MSIPPIDVTRWAARAFTLLDEAGRAMRARTPPPPRRPSTDRRTPPEIW
ncbi:MAG: hypothetical protein WBJ44_02615 [Propionicimonas sp.]